MKLFIVVLLAATLMVSCRKGASNPIEPLPTQEKVSDYFPLTDGSYWIYQEFDADSTMSFIQTTVFDSLAVEKDTVVRGFTFKKFTSTLFGTRLFRDSSGYLVDEFGNRQFSVDHGTASVMREYVLFPDTTVVSTTVMMSTDSLAVAPAGQFDARYVLGTLTSSGQNTVWSGKRYFFRSYAKNVGMICRRGVWVQTGTYLELRLVRYKAIKG